MKFQGNPTSGSSAGSADRGRCVKAHTTACYVGIKLIHLIINFDTITAGLWANKKSFLKSLKK
jgi:hypothetical protein